MKPWPASPTPSSGPAPGGCSSWATLCMPGPGSPSAWRPAWRRGAPVWWRWSWALSPAITTARWATPRSDGGSNRSATCTVTGPSRSPTSPRRTRARTPGRGTSTPSSACAAASRRSACPRSTSAGASAFCRPSGFFPPAAPCRAGREAVSTPSRPGGSSKCREAKKARGMRRGRSPAGRSTALGPGCTPARRQRSAAVRTSTR
jgi:hypothetical protein